MINMWPKPFSFLDQAKEFKQRGIKFERLHKTENELVRIGYYKLKEFTYPFSNWKNYWHKYTKQSSKLKNEIDIYKRHGSTNQLKWIKLEKRKKNLLNENRKLQRKFVLRYNNVHFKEIEMRYYQDKLLRMDVLDLLEALEVSFNSQIANILGKKYGPFGYLDFFKWASSKEKYCYVLKQQHILKNNINKTLRHRHLLNDLHLDKNFKQAIYIPQNILKQQKNVSHKIEKYPTIWLAVDIVNFGITTHLIGLMDTADTLIMYHRYNCYFSHKKHWVQWLKALNIIRNVCAHNGDLIDFKFITPPRVPSIFRQYVCNKYHTSIASILFVMKYLMLSIDPLCKMYDFKDIYKILYKIANKSNFDSNTIIQMMGFKDLNSLKHLTDTYNDIEIHYHSLDYNLNYDKYTF